MLDYIREQVALKTGGTKQPQDDDTALVAEYAHLFQELDDISVEGTEENKMRPIDIPLNGDGQLDGELDDLEIEEIGYNMATGTISVPADAAIQAEYAQMKTEGEFINESYNLIQRDEESHDDYEARREQYARDKFMEYRNQVLQEGMYGYNRIKANDDRVPGFASINFGKYGDSDYRVRFEIQHQVDPRGNITRKQIESVHIAEACAMCENLMDKVAEDLRERYHIAESANIWDNVIPSVLVAPIDPIDKHSVIIGFKNGANMSAMNFYRFTNPVTKYSTSGQTVLESADVEAMDPAKVRELSKFCLTKNAAIKESMKENPRYHRFIQEAINIGGGDGGDSAPASTDQNNDPPPADGGSGDSSSSTPEADNKATVQVDTNDVSDQIADSVSAQNNGSTPDDTSTSSGEPGNDAVTDIPENEVPDLPEGTDDTSTGDDTVSADNMGMEDIDSQIEGLNAAGNEEGALTADEVDVENMSIEDLLAQGTERLKGMSLSQLKEFLANNDPAAVQEAFILTNANINDEVDIYLKKVLGVLNDNKLEISQLVSEFKKYGKKLNKVLTKASKAQVYNDNEKDNLKKLNKCLADLMVTIKASTDKSSMSVIKRLVKAFTSQAAVVGKIVEKKKKELPKAKKKEVKSEKKSVQESFSNFLNADSDDGDDPEVIEEFTGPFTTAGNVKKKIRERIMPVLNDMEDIVRSDQQGKLTRGKIVKLYKPSTATTGFAGYGSGIATGTSVDYDVDSPAMSRMKRLIQVLSKANDKERLRKVFTRDEISTLSDLESTLDDLIGDIGDILSDAEESSSLLKAIGKEAKSFSDTARKVLNFT